MARNVVEQEVQENEIDLFDALVEGADPEDMLDALLDAMDAEDAPVEEGWKRNVVGAVLGTAAVGAGLHQMGKVDSAGNPVSGVGNRIVAGAKQALKPGQAFQALKNRRQMAAYNKANPAG